MKMQRIKRINFRLQCELSDGTVVLNATFASAEVALNVAQHMANKYAGRLAFCNVDAMEDGAMASNLIKHGPYAYLFTEIFTYSDYTTCEYKSVA